MVSSFSKRNWITVVPLTSLHILIIHETTDKDFEKTALKWLSLVLWKRGWGEKRMAWTEKNIGRVRLAVLHSPNCSIRLRASNLNLSQTSSVQSFIHTRWWCARNCWKEITMCSLHLQQYDFFASVESHFYLNGFVNK